MAMSEQTQPVAGAAASTTKARTSFGILGAISLSHLLNDMIQSLILAIYPLLQSEFSLTFMQIGMITLTFQLASSLLQPVVGYWTDKYPMPWSRILLNPKPCSGTVNRNRLTFYRFCATKLNQMLFFQHRDRHRYSSKIVNNFQMAKTEILFHFGN